MCHPLIRLIWSLLGHIDGFPALEGASRSMLCCCVWKSFCGDKHESYECFLGGLLDDHSGDTFVVCVANKLSWSVVLGNGTGDGKHDVMCDTPQRALLDVEHEECDE